MLVIHQSAPFASWTFARKLLVGLCLGTLMMMLHHLGVLAAWWNPPAGYSSLGYVNNLDVPQYLTWIQQAQNRILVPNLHAPWITEPALFQPLIVMTARLPFPVIYSYYGLHFLMYWLASFCLIEAGFTFCRSWRQLAMVAVVVICELPLKMLAWTAGKFLSPALAEAFAYGPIEFCYDSADGLFRGGISNSMTLTFGTASMLAGFTLLAKYQEKRRPALLVALLAVCTISAILHPYEIFVIGPGVMIFFLIYRQWRDALLVIAASAAGMAPHFYFLLRSSWLLDNSEGIHGTVNTLSWAPATYGLPFLILAGLMVLNLRMRWVNDQILQIWFFTSLLIPFMPGSPFAFHLFDGFAYCLALLLTRVASNDKQLRLLWEKRPALAKSLAMGFTAPAVAALCLFFTQLAADGRAKQPEVFLSSVIPSQDKGLVEWTAAHIPAGKLVLSPDKLSPWITAGGVQTLASHDVMSITFKDQLELVQSFYAGKQILPEIISSYGISYLILREDSKIILPETGFSAVASIAGYKVFEVAGGKMKIYPGLKKIRPGFEYSASKKLILDHVGRVYRLVGLL